MPSTAYFFNLRDGYPFAESCVGKCIACGDETSTQDSGVCYRCPSGKHYVHSGCITATFLDSSDSRRHVGEGDAYDMTFPCRECAREGQKSGHEFCVVPAHTTYELVGQTEYGPVYVTEVDDEFDASAVSTIRLKDRFRYRATAKVRLSRRSLNRIIADDVSLAGRGSEDSLCVRRMHPRKHQECKHARALA